MCVCVCICCTYSDTVLDKLARQDVGSFVVRDSTTHAGCYALSIRVDKSDAAVDQGISHYLITRTPRGTVRLKVRCLSVCQSTTSLHYVAFVINKLCGKLRNTPPPLYATCCSLAPAHTCLMPEAPSAPCAMNIHDRQAAARSGR